MRLRRKYADVLSEIMRADNTLEIEIAHIKKKYKKKEVLKDICLKTTGGKCIGILGGNGSGKSTLLSILAGVLKGAEGEFLWQGKNLLENSSLCAEIIGYIPQGIPLLEELSARDNLLLWYDRGKLEQELKEGVLAMLGMKDFLKTPVYKMSGGMKKRLAIGCAVAGNPRILLMDEPSAALDLECKERIINYICEFKEQGGTIFLATHDVQEIEVCDEWYILKDGVLHAYQYDGNVHRLVGML